MQAEKSRQLKQRQLWWQEREQQNASLANTLESLRKEVANAKIEGAEKERRCDELSSKCTNLEEDKKKIATEVGQQSRMPRLWFECLCLWQVAQLRQAMKALATGLEEERASCAQLRVERKSAQNEASTVQGYVFVHCRRRRKGCAKLLSQSRELERTEARLAEVMAKMESAKASAQAANDAASKASAERQESSAENSAAMAELTQRSAQLAADNALLKLKIEVSRCPVFRCARCAKDHVPARILRSGSFPALRRLNHCVHWRSNTAPW